MWNAVFDRDAGSVQRGKRLAHQIAMTNVGQHAGFSFGSCSDVLQNLSAQFVYTFSRDRRRAYLGQPSIGNRELRTVQVAFVGDENRWPGADLAQQFTVF